MEKKVKEIEIPESELLGEWAKARSEYNHAKNKYEKMTDAVKKAMLKYARAKVGDVVELVEKHPVMETLGWREENTKMTIGKVSVREELIGDGCYRPSSDDFKAVASYCIQYEGIAELPNGTVYYPHYIDDDRVLEMKPVK